MSRGRRCRGRAVPASVAAPGIAPAPAPAPQRVCAPAGRLAEPLRRSWRASIPVGLVGGGGAGGRELTGNSPAAGVGELGSLGRGSRQQRVEGPGNRLRWALERDEDTCAASPLSRPPVSPSAKPAPYWFTQPWKPIQIPIPGFRCCVTTGKPCNLSESRVPSLRHGRTTAPPQRFVGG